MSHLLPFTSCALLCSQLAALTNGSEAIARGVLEKAGLAKCVQHVFDINMAGAWKPHRHAYEFAVQQLGYAPNQVGMQDRHVGTTVAASACNTASIKVQLFCAPLAVLLPGPSNNTTGQACNVRDCPAGHVNRRWYD